jgi:GNAT superfamily N-acetyltransferase
LPARQRAPTFHGIGGIGLQVLIDGHAFSFVDDVLSRNDARESYFLLANTVFGLEFDKWYNSGYWDDKFIPYVLLDNGMAVSSVAVCVNELTWHDSKKRYVQISTVMTLPEYRKKGLNRWLMEYVIKEWKEKCDAIYLLANDTVVDFYPKFGFGEFTEYDHIVPVQRIAGTYKKLNINNADDLNLIVNRYKVSNPFSELNVDNPGQFVFHCLQFLYDNIYYLEQFDAVVIVTYNGKMMTCYDIFTDSICSINDILGILANENTESAYLGFTPKQMENCLVQETKEEDNHLFVLNGKDNIFKDYKIMLPLLSRA